MVACKILASSLQVETKSDGPLQWRYNERAGVSNHHPHDCLLNRLFRSKSKKTAKLRVTSLLVTGEFPAQRAELFPFDDITMQKTIIWKDIHNVTYGCMDVFFRNYFIRHRNCKNIIGLLYSIQPHTINKLILSCLKYDNRSNEIPYRLLQLILITI